MKLLATLNPEQVSEEEARNYPVREAARAVVLDADNRVALLHVTSQGYYKLPGGGLDDDTDKIAALNRECLEEIGCAVTVVEELGCLVEHRKMFSLEQVSYCYLARVVGEKGSPSFTEKELADGFSELWLPYDEALATLEGSDAKNQEGRLYIVPRDIIILKEARTLL